jgi:hypothetical protein
MRTLSLDFETPYGKDFSVVDLGYWKYARDERCVPYLVSVCDGSESWAGEPKDFNFEPLRGAQLISHNAAFDEEIALAAKERGLFEVPDISTYGNKNWLCSLNMSAYLWNVRSLAESCFVGLGVNVDKGVRDRAKDKTVEDMKREGWWDDMLKYGISDARLCWELWNRHNAKWPEFERRLSRLTIDQGRHGVRIDVAALDEGIRVLQNVIFNAQQRLPWVARGKKPASPIGLAEECRSVGIPPPPVKLREPEAAEEWEALYAPQYPFVYALRNLRKAKKTIATLETIKLRLRPDETVAFSLKYAGAHTLRWAGDSGWNLQNQNREPLFIDPEFSFIFDKKLCKKYADEFDAEQTEAFGALKNGTTFLNMRGLIIARPGMKLAPVDSAQIEPRVLNTLAGNTGLLDKIRSGMGVYEAFARQSLGWTGGDLKTQNKKIYALSKADVLGLGFRAGWEKFILVAWVMAGLDITEGDEEFAIRASVDGLIHKRRRIGDKWSYEKYIVFDDAFSFGPAMEDCTMAQTIGPWEDCVFVKKIRKVKGAEIEAVVPLSVYGMRSRVTVQQFRDNNPLNVALWENFDAALEAAVGEDLVVTGPHGGILTYRKIRREPREVVNKDTGEKYIRKVFTGEIGGRRYVLHGGVLTENLVQWVARMAFAERMLALHDRLHSEDPRQWVLYTVHDEAVPEILEPANPEATRKQIEAELSVTPDWLAGCPLGAECKITDRYLK